MMNKIVMYLYFRIICSSWEYSGLFIYTNGKLLKTHYIIQQFGKQHVWYNFILILMCMYKCIMKRKIFGRTCTRLLTVVFWRWWKVKLWFLYFVYLCNVLNNFYNKLIIAFWFLSKNIWNRLSTKAVEQWLEVFRQGLL